MGLHPQRLVDMSFSVYSYNYFVILLLGDWILKNLGSPCVSLRAPTTFNISEVWTKGPTTYTWLELYLRVLVYFKNLLPTVDSENEKLFYFPN